MYRRAVATRRRRYVPRRRYGRVVRRFRRIPRLRFSSNRKTGNFSVKCTRIVTLGIPPKENYYWLTWFLPSDFREFSNLSANFESFRFRRLVVTAYPMQNVANNSTSICPTYAAIPWKNKEPAKDVLFSDLMSVDKAKIARQTQVLRQSYVPAVHMDSNSLIGVDIKYAPKLRGSEESAKLRHYAGLLAFQGLEKQETATNFCIKMDAYVTFYRQSIIKMA